MTVFQPISPKKAYKILSNLPTSIDLKTAIQYISTQFEINPMRAKMYIRALRAWGLIIGKNELSIKKVSFNQFLNIIKQQVIKELPQDFFKILIEFSRNNITMSPDLLRLLLSNSGVNFSSWKLNIILRYLKFLGLIYEIKILAHSNLGVELDLKDLIVVNIKSSGAIPLNNLLAQLERTYGLSPCEIKKLLLELYHSRRIVFHELPEGILELWLSAKNPCEIIKIPINGPTGQKILLLRDIHKPLRKILDIRDNTIFLKVFEGPFIVTVKFNK